MIRFHRPLTPAEFADFVSTHRGSTTAAAAGLLGVSETDPWATAAAERAFAEVWARRWSVWLDPVQTLRRALVHRTRPGRLAEPPLREPPHVLALRARAASARAASSTSATLNRRSLVIGGVGAATAAGAVGLGVSVSRAVHTTTASINGGTRLALTIELVGQGPRRTARVFTSDPQWAADLPVLVGSFLVDEARSTRVVLPTPGLTADATLQTLVLYQPGLVFADVVDTGVVSLVTSADEPMAAGVFARSPYGDAALVWGDDTGRVVGESVVMQAPFPGDPSRVCYVVNGNLVVRNLSRALSQTRLPTRHVPVVPTDDSDSAPSLEALAVTFPDGTSLLAVTASVAGELSWEMPSLASSTARSGTTRLWHVTDLPSRAGQSRSRLTWSAAVGTWQYRLEF